MARIVVVSCCLLALAVVAVRAAPQDKLDSVDVDRVLNNERLLHAYMQCVLDADDGKCTSEGKEIKRRLPSLVQTGCAECTPRQLERAIKILKHVTEKHPAEWTQAKAKYDPTGEFANKYADTWRQYGINF